MPLNFAKKPAAGAAPAPTAKPAPSAAPAPQAGKPAPSPAPQAQSHMKAGGTASWLKTGAAARSMLQAEEAKAAARKAEQDKMRRFRCGVTGEKRVTFLDGEIGADGLLDVPMFHEHEVLIGQNRERFLCTAETDKSQPCPICSRPEGNTPYLVGVLTVIDHTGYIPSQGKNTGKLMGQNEPQLYPAKRDTLGKLQKLASKRGGLTFCTFDISRDGERSAAVGSTFEFVEKYPTAQAAQAANGGKLEDFVPANYAEEITYRSPEELIELGVGKAFTGPGTGKTQNLGSHL